ncbi:MAG: FecR domain-containing protein [Pseudomonadota bacterium]
MITTAKRSLAMVALLASTSALAATPDWRVSEVSGSVTIARSGKVLNARQDTTLRPGDVIRTGKKGRAVLVRGKEFVVVSPDAKLKVAVPEETGPVTQFFQYLGNALFKIEKKSTPHFGVKTPYLAAVVKGTTFNVSVGSDRSSVQVTEGAVEVATGNDLEAALITPGLIGYVDADDAGELFVISGGRSGEDLSGAVVRGAPEFVAKPPQARMDRGANDGMSAVSGRTPAAVRSNRIVNDDAALASSGQIVTLGLMDDDVSGGSNEAPALTDAALTDAVLTEAMAPEALFEDSVSPGSVQQDSLASDDQNQVSAPQIVPVSGVIAGGEGIDPVSGFDPAGTGENDEVNVSAVPNVALTESDEGDDSIEVAEESEVTAPIVGSDEATSGLDSDESDSTTVDSNSAAGGALDGTEVDVEIDTGSATDGSVIDSDAGGLVYAEDQENGSCAGVANCSGGEKPSDDDGGSVVSVGFDTGANVDQDDGNNGHGNDDDGVDESNPGNGRGNGNGLGNGNSAGDEADGSGVEVGIDAGDSGDVAELDFDDGGAADDDGTDEGGNGICLGPFCIDLRDDDDKDGRDENDDEDGRACGRILCIEGPGIDDGDDEGRYEDDDEEDDIDLDDDLDLDLEEDDDGNNGHGNDDDGDDDSNPGKGKGRGNGGNGNDDD